MNPKNKDLRDLKIEWYKKLKDDGFEDIESSPDNPDNFKQWAAHRFTSAQNNGLSRADVLFRGQIKENYYRLAGHLLYEYPFENETDRLIWELHADGHTYVSIIKMLKEQHSIVVYRDSIRKVIKKLREAMSKHYGGHDE